MICTERKWKNFPCIRSTPKNADEAKKLHRKCKTLRKMRFKGKEKELSKAKRNSQKRKSEGQYGWMNNTSFNTEELVRCKGCFESFPEDKITSRRFCERCELYATISCNYCDIPYSATYFEDWYSPTCRECTMDLMEEKRICWRRNCDW